MWHRGITHSIFMTPIWALFFFLLAIFLFKVKDIKLFFLAWLAVVIHSTSDLFNAWGTGYLEPFSKVRLTFGTVSIVDFVIWAIFAGAFLFSKRNKSKSPQYYKMAWALIALHIILQSTQGFLIYKQYELDYDSVALSANFIPWTYSVITKKDGTVTIYQDALFKDKQAVYVLQSNENADLDQLFSELPQAKTLYEWAPFVVIVDDYERIGLYDPRFYRNGQSFLFEYIEKSK